MDDLQPLSRPALPQLRWLFPRLAEHIGAEPLAYLDNAATTQIPLPVLDTMRRFEEHDRASIHRGVHAPSQRATAAFERARLALKGFVGGGSEHELIFTAGTTDALNMAAHGLSSAGGRAAPIGPGDEIVVSGLEHHANLVPWQQAARRTGATVRILQPDASGRLHAGNLVRLLSARTRVVALTACANATGERPPYEDLLALASAAGALTVLDAAQAVAHDAFDLATLPCDLMAFSGHKMYGPMGIGALVGRRSALERLEPLRYGGGMVAWVHDDEAGFAALPARLEGGTPNVAGAVGMAAAAAFVDECGREEIAAHVRSLRAHAAAGLAAIDGVTVLSPDAAGSAIVSFVVDGAHPHDLGTLLDERAIAVRTGHHCAQPLIEHLGLGPTTRASFALYNTHDEVERLLAAVAHATTVLR